MIDKIQTMLSNKKTYLVMIAGITAALAGLATGELTPAQAISGILGSLGLGTLRAGIAKVGK